MTTEEKIKFSNQIAKNIDESNKDVNLKIQRSEEMSKYMEERRKAEYKILQKLFSFGFGKRYKLK